MYCVFRFHCHVQVLPMYTEPKIYVTQPLASPAGILQLGKTLATGNSGTAVVHHSFLCILCEDTFAATFAGRSDRSRSVASPDNFQGTTGMCICFVCVVPSWCLVHVHKALCSVVSGTIHK